MIQGRSSVHQGWSQQPSRWPRFLGTRIFLDLVWGGGLFFAQQLSKHPPALRCRLGSELWDLGHVLCVTGFFLASRGGLLFRTRALVSGGAFRHRFSLVGPLCHGDSFLLAASWHQGQQLHSPGSYCLYAVARTGLLETWLETEIMIEKRPTDFVSVDFSYQPRPLPRKKKVRF